MKRRLLALLCVPVLLSGCVTFLPAYDEALYKHLSTVSDDVGKIHTAVEVTHTGPVDYSVVEPYYTEALSHVAAAKTIAAGASVYSKGKLAGRPADDLTAAITNCETVLKLEMERHRGAPVDAVTEQGFSDTKACAIPATMEALLKRGV